MILRPTTLSLITMYQCTAACEHCCFSCRPKITDRLPPERLAEFIDQASAFQTIQVVVFTGGECFMPGADLDRLVARAKKQNYITRTVTNGYRAINPSVARNRLERIREAGLDELNLSTGYFHQKYVPLENIIHGMEAGLNLGLRGAIMIEDVLESSGTLERLQSHKPFIDAVRSGQLKLLRSPWMSFHGKDAIKPTPRPSYEESSCTGCKSVLSVVAITPEEDMYACCGLPMREIPAMRLANLKGVTDLKELIDGLPDDFLKIWLSLEGPEAIIRFAASHDSSIPVPKEAMHVCQACRIVYSDPRIKTVLRQHQPEHRQAMIDGHFRRINSTRLAKLYKTHIKPEPALT